MLKKLLNFWARWLEIWYWNIFVSVYWYKKWVMSNFQHFRNYLANLLGYVSITGKNKMHSGWSYIHHFEKAILNTNTIFFYDWRWITVSFSVNLELIHDLWVPNIYIYNLKSFKVIDVLSKLAGLWINNKKEVYYRYVD